MKWHGLQQARGVFVCFTLVAMLVFAVLPTEAINLPAVTVRPISNGVSSWSPSGCSSSSEWDCVNDTSSDGDTSYLNGSGNSTSNVTFNMGGASTSGQTATSIEVHVVGRAAVGSIFGYEPITVMLTIGGTGSSQDITYNSTSYSDSGLTFSGGPWTKSQVDSATITISKGANGLRPAIRITQLYAFVNYSSPAQSQSTYRFYANADSITPGTPSAAANTVADINQATPFRARIGISVTDRQWETGSWGPHNNQYKLQYTLKNAGTCSGSSGWTDVVSGSGAIRWYNNPSVSENTTPTNLGGNDVNGTKVYQYYRESNPFTLRATTAISSTAVWDFALQTVGTTPGTSYCLRVLQNDGSALNGYSANPELLITGDYSVAIVDAGGSVVASPTVSFPTQTVSTTNCNGSTATLGQSSQRLRITNDVLKNGWNVTIAATAGPTASWTAGASHYDFNDTSAGGCTDGGDSDAYPGIMVVDPSASSIASKSGCNTTGISRGSETFFDQGTTDAITLLSANSSSQRFCYWDVTNISLAQAIPKATAAGTYNLDMTVTVTAL